MSSATPLTNSSSEKDASMQSTLSALGRWSVAGGLWLLVGLSILLTTLGHGLSALGLLLGEWAKARLDKIKGRGK
jgi:hypothetical protein